MDVSEQMSPSLEKDLLHTGLVFLGEGEESLGESCTSQSQVALPAPHLFFLIK